MDIIWNEMIPFKGIKYIQRYYRNYYPTEMEDWKICPQSKNIKLLYFFAFLKIVHLFYLFIFFKPKNYNDLMFHYDYATMMNMPFLNGNVILILLMVMYFLNLLYFNFDNIIMKTSNAFLMHGDNTFFIKKLYKGILIGDYI